MSIISSLFPPRSNVHDPFSVDLWGFPIGDILPNGRPIRTHTQTDWKETAEAHVFKVDLPGFNKNEVKIEIEQEKVVQISGERNKEVEEKTGKWHRVERSSGKFIRRIRLPENSKIDQVKAELENGVLTITVPKEAGKKISERLIDISN